LIASVLLAACLAAPGYSDKPELVWDRQEGVDYVLQYRNLNSSTWEHRIIRCGSRLGPWQRWKCRRPVFRKRIRRGLCPSGDEVEFRVAFVDADGNPAEGFGPASIVKICCP